ncbi:hypothetical protein [Engelhardtia mirabilis]|uniref:Anti-sigma-28 factor FlgM C-terminal domain-containing protein n=1 Tax=Engelhardtia mirabilis TaxID=2528011 RepID=A0A518BSR2_9BACT|nr:hypothetical protein Pla133_51180 [Planctomycetes bacterium Pla133]QDV04320.1 hypothetical protein Pla86_51150 [Planctomycetes bacterium Pla86]
MDIRSNDPNFRRSQAADHKTARIQAHRLKQQGLEQGGETDNRHEGGSRRIQAHRHKMQEAEAKPVPLPTTDDHQTARIQAHRLKMQEAEGTPVPLPTTGDHQTARIQAHRLKNQALEEAGQARTDAPAARQVTGLDRIDLSESARAAARVVDNAATPPDRLAALRELYQSGRLNSPERLERAAAAILGKSVDQLG